MKWVTSAIASPAHDDSSRRGIVPDRAFVRRRDRIERGDIRDTKLVRSLHTREAEQNADAFAIATMHALDRSPAPMGDLLFRVSGAEGNRTIGILATHPLTEDRRALMRREDRAPTGPALLSDDALKAICQPRKLG
jgi:predicted Zn-dependent protease